MVRISLSNVYFDFKDINPSSGFLIRSDTNQTNCNRLEASNFKVRETDIVLLIVRTKATVSYLAVFWLIFACLWLYHVHLTLFN